MNRRKKHVLAAGTTATNHHHPCQNDGQANGTSAHNFPKRNPRRRLIRVVFHLSLVVFALSLSLHVMYRGLLSHHGKSILEAHQREEDGKRASPQHERSIDFETLHPRQVRVEMTYDDSQVLRSWRTNRLDDPKTTASVHANSASEPLPSKKRRRVKPMTSEIFQKHLVNSNDYKRTLAAPLDDGDCRPQYQWQTSLRIDCNSIHETMLLSRHDDDYSGILGSGYWRDVWAVPDRSFTDNDSSNATSAIHKKVVVKTMRFVHKLTPRNLDRHRRDALAMERLIASPHVVDIYGFCGNTGVFAYADGGDLSKALFPKTKKKRGDKETTTITRNQLTKHQKLRIAAQVAKGLADMHTSDHPERAAMAHTDISLSQFVQLNGVFQLNDFNRARFLAFNSSAASRVSGSAADAENLPPLCAYYIGHNPGKNRSPEEYSYQPQSEMVDVYSLGNLFFSILQDEPIFRGVKSNEVALKVKAGERPAVYRDIWESQDTVDKILLKCMIAMHAQDPKERASARQVQGMLQDVLAELDPHWKITDRYDAAIL